MARVCGPHGQRSPWSGTMCPHQQTKPKRRFLPNLQYRRFWVERNRWVRLPRLQRRAHLIDKNGIDAVLDRPARTRPGLNQRGSTPWPAAKGGRAKIKLWCPRPAPVTSTPRPRTRNHARQDGDFQFDPKARKARRIQRKPRSSDDHSPALNNPSAQEGKEKTRWGSCRRRVSYAGVKPAWGQWLRRGQLHRAQLLRELSRSAAMPLSSARRHQACRSAASCSRLR